MALGWTDVTAAMGRSDSLILEKKLFSIFLINFSFSGAATFGQMIATLSKSFKDLVI